MEQKKQDDSSVQHAYLSRWIIKKNIFGGAAAPFFCFFFNSACFRHQESKMCFLDASTTSLENVAETLRICMTRVVNTIT